jgi:hypothetical protein
MSERWTEVLRGFCGLGFPSPSLFSLYPSVSMASKEGIPSMAYTEHLSKGESNPVDSLTPPTLTPKEEARAWRKVDIRLIPIVALLYLFSFMDRGTSRRFFIFLARVSLPVL